MVDEQGRVAINSPETLRALDYARAVFRTLAPGTLSWNDASNNKAFLAGEIALTDNSTSIYGKALADKLPIAPTSLMRPGRSGQSAYRPSCI